MGPDGKVAVSEDDNQQLCGTEDQVQELPHEKLMKVDEETSDNLTEEQYDIILELLGKMQLLLKRPLPIMPDRL